MVQCLVTKLKGQVSNDSLRKRGELRFKMVSGGSFHVEASATDGFTLKILTSGVTFTAPAFASGTTEQSVPATAVRDFTVSGACEISMMNKYALKDIRNTAYIDFNLDELYPNNELTLISFSAYQNLIHGNIKGLKNCTGLRNLTILSSNVIGDLSDFVAAPTCYNITLSNGSVFCDIGGDISNLSRLPGLVDFNFRNMVGLYGNISVFEGISGIRDINMNGCPNIVGSVTSLANHASLRNPQIYGTGITGTLGELLVNTPALVSAYLPNGVKWTDADAAVADARMQANGGAPTSSGHYFGGGTHVDSY